MTRLPPPRYARPELSPEYSPLSTERCPWVASHEGGEACPVVSTGGISVPKLTVAQLAALGYANMTVAQIEAIAKADLTAAQLAALGGSGTSASATHLVRSTLLVRALY
jgi:hypothetical protein